MYMGFDTARIRQNISIFQFIFGGQNIINFPLTDTISEPFQKFNLIQYLGFHGRHMRVTQTSRYQKLRRMWIGLECPVFSRDYLVRFN